MARLQIPFESVEWYWPLNMLDKRGHSNAHAVFLVSTWVNAFPDCKIQSFHFQGTIIITTQIGSAGLSIT